MNKSYRVIEEVLRLVGVSSHQNCPKSTVSRGMGGDQCLCHDQTVLWYSLEETRHSLIVLKDTNWCLIGFVPG